MYLPLMCWCTVHLPAGAALYRQPGTSEGVAGDIKRSTSGLGLRQWAVSNTAGHAPSHLKVAGQLVACEVRTLVS